MKALSVKILLFLAVGLSIGIIVLIWTGTQMRLRPNCGEHCSSMQDQIISHSSK